MDKKRPPLIDIPVNPGIVVVLTATDPLLSVVPPMRFEVDVALLIVPFDSMPKFKFTPPSRVPTNPFAPFAETLPGTVRVVPMYVNPEFPKIPLDVPEAVSKLPAVVLPAIVAPPV